MRISDWSSDVCSSDLGNAFGSMLRPTEKPWFHQTTRYDPAPEDARQWLEWSNGVMRRAMYDRVAQFTRATSEGDHDFAAFGQRSEEHTSELQSLMRISYAVFCLQKNIKTLNPQPTVA